MHAKIRHVLLSVRWHLCPPTTSPCMSKVCSEKPLQQLSNRLHKPQNRVVHDLHMFLGILHCLRTFTHFPGYLTVSNTSLKENNPFSFPLKNVLDIVRYPRKCAKVRRWCKMPRKMCKSGQTLQDAQEHIGWQPVCRFGCGPHRPQFRILQELS